jgi:hypothetical protein
VITPLYARRPGAGPHATRSAGSSPTAADPSRIAMAYFVNEARTAVVHVMSTRSPTFTAASAFLSSTREL